MDKLLQQLSEENTDVNLEAAPGKGCFNEGKVIGDDLRSQLSSHEMLSSAILTVLPDLNGLLRCDVYDEGAVVMLQEMCPPVESDLKLAVVGYSLLLAALVVLYVILPPTARRFKAAKRDFRKEY